MEQLLQALLQSQVQSAEQIGRLSNAIATLAERDAVTSSTLPKVPPPKRLDGKDRRAVATWIQNMRSTLALSPEKDGTKQVAYAALFLEDAALAWFNTKASIADPSLKSSAGFASFDQFAASRV